jgi:predicted PurR-regulated permease PerM
VLALRLLQNYFPMPALLGNAVGLSPLIILVSVSAAGLLFGGLARDPARRRADGSRA